MTCAAVLSLRMFAIPSQAVEELSVISCTTKISHQVWGEVLIRVC